MAKTTNTSGPLVAIDLGSTGVKAMAAARVGDSLHILGYEESNLYPNYIDKGEVKQTSNAGFMISEVLKKLSNRIGEKNLDNVFVCLGCKSMKVYTVKSVRTQVRKRVVEQSLLDAMEQECRDKIEARYPNVGVLAIVPAFYCLDGVEQDFPPRPDQYAIMVETHFNVFVTSRVVADTFQKSFDQSGRCFEQTFVRPEALLSAFVATDAPDMYNRGCAVLDFGAETTTLSIFKAGQYLVTRVYPFGSNYITRFIAKQGLPVELSERLKTEYGYAGQEQVEKNFRMRVNSTEPGVGQLIITATELADLIAVNLEYIWGETMQTIADHADRIDTLYLTGGGAKLKGLDRYLAAKLNIRVVIGEHGKLLTRNSEDEYTEPRYASLVGTLLLAADYREKHPNQPQQKRRELLNKLRQASLELFTEQEF